MVWYGGLASSLAGCHILCCTEAISHWWVRLGHEIIVFRDPSDWSWGLGRSQAVVCMLVGGCDPLCSVTSTGLQVEDTSSWHSWLWGLTCSHSGVGPLWTDSGPRVSGCRALGVLGPRLVHWYVGMHPGPSVGSVLSHSVVSDSLWHRGL